MTLKDTCKQMKSLLEEVCSDLDKAEKGNKAASQRVRTGTIKLEKIAKHYRKESVHAEKGGGGKKKKASAAKKPVKKKAAPPKAAAKKPAKVVKKEVAKPQKKATAKLPKKKGK